MCSAQDMGCADGRDACGQYIPRIVRADSRFRNSCGPAIRCSRIPCSRIPCSRVPCSSVGTAWPRSQWLLEQGCSRSGRRCRPQACRESHRGLLRLHRSVWCPVLAAPYRLRHRCHARSGHGTVDRHGTHYAAQSQSRPLSSIGLRLDPNHFLRNAPHSAPWVPAEVTDGMGARAHSRHKPRHDPVRWLVGNRPPGMRDKAAPAGERPSSNSSSRSTRSPVAPATARPASSRVARAIRVHRPVVWIGDDHLVVEPLDVARDPLALGARLAQTAGARPRAEHGGDPLPTGRDPTVGDRPVVGLEEPLPRALVPLQADVLHGG